MDPFLKLSLNLILICITRLERFVIDDHLESEPYAGSTATRNASLPEKNYIKHGTAFETAS